MPFFWVSSDQTDLFFTMADAMGLDTSGASNATPITGATASASATMPDTGGTGIEGSSAGTALLALSAAFLLSGALLLSRMLRRDT